MTVASSKTVRCAWETTLRHATGMPRWTVRASFARSARAIAAATADGVVCLRPTSGSVSGTRPKKSVETSPARNRSFRRTATSWSRFVTTPWILARARTFASFRAAASRVGAWAITLASIAS
jgi:hypothetical protein